MLCSNCGNKVSDKNKFCESCGTPVSSPVASGAVAASAQTNTAPETVKKTTHQGKGMAATSELQLQAWAGWTWLFKKNYGTLSITESHLEHNLHTLWASNFWSIVAKLFNWGFDWLSSTFINEGSTDLRAINSIRLYKIDWLAWRAPMLFIWSVGLPSIYYVSSKQLPEVEGFIENLKVAVSKAKFETKE